MTITPRRRAALLAAFILSLLATRYVAAEPDAGPPPTVDAALDADDQAEEEARVIRAAEGAYRARWGILPPPPGVAQPVPVVLPMRGGPVPVLDPVDVVEPPDAPPLGPRSPEDEARERLVSELIRTAIEATTDAVVDGVKRAPQSRRGMALLGVLAGAGAAVAGPLTGEALDWSPEQTTAGTVGLVALVATLFLFAIDDDAAGQ